MTTDSPTITGFFEELFENTEVEESDLFLFSLGLAVRLATKAEEGQAEVPLEDVFLSTFFATVLSYLDPRADEEREDLKASLYSWTDELRPVLDAVTEDLGYADSRDAIDGILDKANS